MRGIGTIFNIITVLIGGSLGLFIGSRLKKSLHEIVIGITGFVSLIIGIQMSLESKNVLIVLISLMLGVIIGDIANIDGFISKIGNSLEKRFAKGEKEQFAKAFITTSIIFCVGPLTILGSIQDGLTGDYKILGTKAVLDGFTAIFYAGAMGMGVLFTVLTIIVVQGGLTLFAGMISVLMTKEVIAELTGVGGVMIISTGLNILEIKKFKTANMLPALLIVPPLVILAQRFFGGI